MRKIITTIFLLLIAHSPHAQSRQKSDEYWWLCPVDRSWPVRPQFSSELAAGSMEVRADSARVVDSGISYFVGGVELIRDGEALQADEVAYDRDHDMINAEGHARVWGPSLLWSGERVLLNARDDLTRLENGEYSLLERQGRGRAETIKNDGRSNVTRLVGVDYTTCPRQAEAWKFSASRIKLDHDEERGYATNALLKVRGVPVFYLPYINFPLSDRRKSGFLTPSFGTSNESGLNVEVPYYFNIAPSQDATFAPRYISDRGTMLGGEYRYMGRDFRSKVAFEYLPGDDLANGEDRSSVAFEHRQYYDDRRGYLFALIQNVSDAQYFEDFGYSLSVTSQRYLDRRIETTYVNNRLWVRGLAQSYQNIDDSIPGRFGPYKRLPQILAQTLFPMYHLKPYFYALSEVTYFDRDDSVTGARVALQPSVSFPYVKPWALIKPSLGVKYSEYVLTESGPFDDNVRDAVPVASLDAQMFAERRSELFGQRFLQTFEPRAFYLAIPKSEQEDIPIFDTGLYDFSFITLFLDNRFSGRDRVGDANQLALGVTSRYISLDTGRELFRYSLGQVYYFRDREIALPGATIRDESTSEFIGEIASNLTESWSARATVQYDPHDQQTEKSAFAVRYAPPDGTVVNAAYRLRRAITDVEQTDLSFRVPMTENLSLIGRWSYSLQSKQSLELVGGMEFESCCWGVRVVSRRFIRNVEGEFDTALFLQFEFKGLGGFGRSTSSFLRRNIPGYEPDF